jgi:uncharacterized protein YecE (DUF72 family)
MSFDRDQLQQGVASLADQGVFIGTSSWKYPGWLGQLYQEDRYIWHGRFSKARFEKLCLTEYAQVFKTVSVDAAYYTFPTRDSLESMVSAVPADFQFNLKVTDALTLKSFPVLPRFGPRAGTANADFLNPDRFASAFLEPCAPFRSNIGLLMFEFSRFHADDFARGREFLERLDAFLSKIPRGWNYAVEIRNRNFLQPEYFATLKQHGVAHIYNAWQDMPTVSEQIAMPDSLTNPDFLVARFLLKPGRKYDDAVKLFSPYQEIKDPYPEGRAAAAELIRTTRRSGGRTKAFIHVNNRFEGNALETIAAILEIVRGDL